MQQFTPKGTNKALNREMFKIILMGLMVLDHIDYFISPVWSDIFHIITRVVAVGFAYLVVEGLHYTHSRQQYVTRLISFGIFMALGNFLLNLFVLRKQYQLSILGDNIFLTLALGAIVICLWDNHQTDLKKSRTQKIIAVVIMVINLLPILEGSFVVVPFMFITQLTHENIKRRNQAYLLLMVFYLIMELPMALMIPNLTPFMAFDSIAMNASDVFFILIIPLLSLYNGKLGPHSRQLKYLFYIFYPLHLWVIHLIANMM